MRNRVAERFFPTELIEARAVAETKRPATPKPFRPAYPGVSVDALEWMRAQDTTPTALSMRRPATPRPQPIVQTDWAGRLAADWRDVNANWDLLTAQTRGAADDFVASRYGYREAERQLLEACVELARDAADWNTMVPELAPAAGPDIVERLDAIAAVWSDAMFDDAEGGE